MMKKQIYIVEYTNEDYIGNQCGTMEIEASDLDEAYDIMDETYSYLSVDTIYASGASYSDL